MQEQKRNEIYDWLRLIATMFVVIGHSAYLSIHTKYGGVDYTLQDTVSGAYYTWYPSVFRFLSGWVYGFHMPLFFMLSGAVLALGKKKSFDIFVKSKIKRLIFPYFIYGWLFMLPVKYLGNFYNSGSLLQAMQGFLSGQDSGHLWFLPALFWCMIVFVIIRELLSKITESNYMLLLISGAIYFLYSYLPFDVLKLKTGLSYIFWFALGYVFEKEKKNYQIWNIRKKVFAIIVLTCIEITNVKYGILNSFFIIIVGSFLTYLLSDLCSCFLKKWTESKVWRVLTRNLFYVYLFHDPLEYVVLRIFFSHNLLSSSAGCYLYTLCRTVVIFCVSILLGEFVRIMKHSATLLLNDMGVSGHIIKKKEF